MYRKELKYLQKWRNRSSRKPLVIRGARQVGKTWLVRELAADFDQLVEINFDKHPEKAKLFQSRDVSKILRLIQVDANTDIVPGKTLLFFDEIQAAPGVLHMLRYFFEDIPYLHVAAAGSLLEFVLADHDFSMPVGRVEYMHLGPMSFEDFIMALGQDRLAEFLENYCLNDEIPESIHLKLMHAVKLFWIVGGMPAALKGFRETDQISEAEREHEIILQTCEDDFGRYGKRIHPPRLRKVFRKLPALVGGRLKYVRIDPQDRSRELSESLELLELAGVWHRIRHSAGNGIPLGAEAKDRDFKPLFLDVGLVSTSLGLSLPGLEMADDLLFVNSGSLAEQFVGQHLLHDRELYERPQLYYWNREKKGSNAEVDYLIAHGQKVVPVEVKAGATGTLRSLQMFAAEKKSSTVLRFNSMPPSTVGFKANIPGKKNQPCLLVSLPVYLAGQSRRILSELKQLGA